MRLRLQERRRRRVAVAADPRAFFSLSEFDELRALVDFVPAIFEEVLDRESLEWHSWSADHKNVLSGEWFICNLYRQDTLAKKRKRKPVPDLDRESLKKWIASVRRLETDFPHTTEILKKFPSVNFAGLSRMGAGSKLSTHTHSNPNSLVMHVGMFIPRGDVGLKVGAEERHWSSTGQVLVFDDSLPHSAWNHSRSDRTVLHIDFEKPPWL